MWPTHFQSHQNQIYLYQNYFIKSKFLQITRTSSPILISLPRGHNHDINNLVITRSNIDKYLNLQSSDQIIKSNKTSSQGVFQLHCTTSIWDSSSSNPYGNINFITSHQTGIVLINPIGFIAWDQVNFAIDLLMIISFIASHQIGYSFKSNQWYQNLFWH